MPLVRIDWLPGRTAEQKHDLVELLTREVARIGKCAPSSVTIIFNEVSAGDWAENGKLLSEADE